MNSRGCLGALLVTPAEGHPGGGWAGLTRTERLGLRIPNLLSWGPNRLPWNTGLRHHGSKTMIAPRTPEMEEMPGGGGGISGKRSLSFVSPPAWGRRLELQVSAENDWVLYGFSNIPEALGFLAAGAVAGWWLHVCVHVCVSFGMSLRLKALRLPC